MVDGDENAQQEKKFYPKQGKHQSCGSTQQWHHDVITKMNLLLFWRTSGDATINSIFIGKTIGVNDSSAIIY